MTDVPDEPKTLTVPRRRIGLLWLVVLALLGAGLVNRLLPGLAERIVNPLTAERTVGGPFALTDQTGRRVTEAALAGKRQSLRIRRSK